VSWWELITTRSRSLKTVVVRWDGEALRVQVYCLQPGEEPAVLIDHLTNKFHCLLDDVYACKHLLEDHQYEVVVKTA
jgi:hypothetical protein